MNCGTCAPQSRYLMRAVAWSILAAAIAVAACTKPTAIWIIPESQDNELWFGLGRSGTEEQPGAVLLVAVYACHSLNEAADEMWSIVWDQMSAATSLPSRVKYGDLPEGFQESVAAKPLKEGCYVARTDGSGYVQFEVLDSGQVREVKRHS
jgi:hypothetical protein